MSTHTHTPMHATASAHTDIWRAHTPWHICKHSLHMLAHIHTPVRWIISNISLSFHLQPLCTQWHPHPHTAWKPVFTLIGFLKYDYEDLNACILPFSRKEAKSHLPLKVVLQNKKTGYVALLPEVLVHMQLQHVLNARIRLNKKWHITTAKQKNICQQC